ncbi:ABC transporter ATP-binding protein [Anoxybacterium hadale]|uniref:ABC transporter ATP-binding protein n=1 Tax=Anoxybacterium hadale TaxID=3408580 RepID=A0ACD1AE60_9FIRM|nr:ABC transporter ATP-binding protein [Clostridiales bacterium]
MNIAAEFINVNKRFPNATYHALDDVNLQIYEGELITILGTSGCGKTTLLKMVNRIYEPDSGEIQLFGSNIMDRDPVILRRGIGYVIQQIGLFPHMTVYNNMATVPRILGWEKQKIDERINELFMLVNLDANEFKHRYPAQLSGGQQQRIGLARALAADPALMLFDEPFGAIDAINREKLQDELLKIHRASRKTFLFVTHDVTEAFKLGTRVLIMDKGRIKQFDRPEKILERPADDFVAALVRSAEKGFAVLEGGGL